MGKINFFLIVLTSVALISCANVPADFEISSQHIKKTARPKGEPLEVIQSAPLPERPSATKQKEHFTVVVNDVPVKELLFAIARDADVEIDVDSDVSGEVTLNAIDATFEEILDRVGRQANIRYSNEEGVIYVQADKPFLRHYEVSYVNMERASSSTITIATEVSSTGRASGESFGNISNTNIDNTSSHQFWKMLQTNVKNIISQNTLNTNNELDDLPVGAIESEGQETNIGEAVDNSSNEEVSSLNRVTISPESGVMSVMATQKQHQLVQEYVDLVVSGAQRQVFIEATVVEIELNDDYQAGVDWSRVLTAGASEGLTFTQSLIEDNFVGSPVNTLAYRDIGGKFQVDVAVSLLSQFGNTKVLSTPKILALNNQTALLKVVDNRIYFTIDVETETTEFGITRTFESEIHTLPVGLVMSVTPQISPDNEVTLNVRPTISRILGFVSDPNPALGGDVESLIPEVSVREIETLLRIKNGDIAVIGGLMQDVRSKSTDGLPGLSKLSYFGDLFSYKENNIRKSELVIFLKPIVANEPSLKSDFASYKRFLEESKPINASVNVR
jgi:MSHA biogenesis protein MshL